MRTKEKRLGSMASKVLSQHLEEYLPRQYQQIFDNQKSVKDVEHKEKVKKAQAELQKSKDRLAMIQDKWAKVQAGEDVEEKDDFAESESNADYGLDKKNDDQEYTEE